MERVPEEVRTPAVARAVVSPSALLLAGSGTALAIIGGLPIAAAAGIGAACWAGRVAFAALRRRAPRPERIDPFAVGDPWRRFVQDALRAQLRFDDTVHHMQDGPLRDRLHDLGGRIDAGVRECWQIACQGASLGKGLQQFDIKKIERDLASQDTPKGALDALAAQQAAYKRIRSVWQEARDKLRVLNAQLDEAVARAIELSLSSTDPSDVSLLAGDVDTLVDDLESLRRAVEEVDAAGGTATP